MMFDPSKIPNYHENMAKFASFTAKNSTAPTNFSPEVAREFPHLLGPSQSEYPFIVSDAKGGAALAVADRLNEVGIEAGFNCGRVAVKDEETFVLARIELGLL